MSETGQNTEIFRQQRIKQELISLKVKKETGAQQELSGVRIIF